jgi:hypothetical protein
MLHEAIKLDKPLLNTATPAGSAPATSPAPRPLRADFLAALDALLAQATQTGAATFDLRAADLHARVGGYPGRGHSLPTCCTAMRERMQGADSILSTPTGGQGAAFHVRYCLPR